MSLNRRKKNLVSEINITPFTDVVLVLLIIFMITTPMLTQPQIKVNLPKTQTSDNNDTSNVDVLISQKGLSYLDGKQVAISSLSDAIKDILLKHPDKGVIVKADRNVKYDIVIKVVEQAKKAGAVKFALAVDSEK
ncbi:MAG: biopolymer transporter ExbD [Elusimicrobiota bacterium]|nr:biopolymer transporter ExbD [Elusimicrobiota bacterium]